MKLQVISAFLLATSWMVLQGRPLQQVFDKTAYYNAMASKDVEVINKQIKIVQASSIPAKEGYEGALLMKKAGLVKKPKEKINAYKSGHSKLEACIKKDKENVELRFLRIMIQEHAPGIVNYKRDLTEDKEIIKRSFKSLSPEVQQFVTDYSKHSKVLDPKDF